MLCVGVNFLLKLKKKNGKMFIVKFFLNSLRFVVKVRDG